MPTIDDLLKEFPEPARSSLQKAWGALPAGRRREAEGMLGLLPGDIKILREVTDHVLEHQKAAFLQNKRNIAIVGPANVGKSTLYNQLIRHRSDQARVSPVPGTTRVNQSADAGLFTVIDTPGMSAAGAAGEKERTVALQAAATADLLVIVFDAGHGIQQDEIHLFADLKALGKPFIVVLNKIDLVADRNVSSVVESVATSLGLESQQVVPIQATNGKDVGRVVLAVAETEPALLMALAEAMPEYRGKLAWQRVTAAATAAAGIGMVPLPFADLIPLLGVQTGMVLTIARIYGFNITRARAKELLITFGLGFGARTLFSQLSKLGGVPGWILAAAIASSTTVAMGYAAIIWFERGERPSQQALQKMTTDLALYLREQLAGSGQTKPNQDTLRQRLTQALNNLPKQMQPADAAAGIKPVTPAGQAQDI